MTMEETQEILQAIKNYLTAGNPVWHKEVVAEALDMAIEALSAEAEQVTGKLNNRDDSLLTADAEAVKERKSKLDLISRSGAIKDISYWATNIIDPKMLVKEDALYILEMLPSVDAVEVVRCKDCKYWKEGKCWNLKGLNKTDGIVNADDFCSYGEREDGEE